MPRLDSLPKLDILKQHLDAQICELPVTCTLTDEDKLWFKFSDQNIEITPDVYAFKYVRLECYAVDILGVVFKTYFRNREPHHDATNQGE